MTTLAAIFRQYGDAYRSQYDERMMPSHHRALRDITQCRTEVMGGHVYRCAACQETAYRYHSCKNRHCPQCGYDAGQQWLSQQQALLLPASYFMVTFTIPALLRRVTRSNQTVMYNVLFRTAAAALQELARDTRFIGGEIGMVGVLHTWGRNLCYHPHVHFLVPAGGLADDSKQWLPARHNFLVPVQALSRLFRAKFRHALQKASLLDAVPVAAWLDDWVVHCKPVGNGVAALKYLAPYIFRVAISNNRLVKVANGKVSFRYRASDTGSWRMCRLEATEFIRRFLQHVLPKGFVKVRYYGLFSPSLRHKLAQVHWALAVHERSVAEDGNDEATTPSVSAGEGGQHEVCCPNCGLVMHLVQTLRPRRGPP